MLALHFIGLAMGLGTSFAHAFFGPKTAKLDRSEILKFDNLTSGLSTMGQVGTILLLVSGIYLIIPYWPAITFMPLLILKLILFAILLILIFMINYLAKKNIAIESERAKRSIELYGKLTLFISVLIVFVAVNVFH